MLVSRAHWTENWHGKLRLSSNSPVTIYPLTLPVRAASRRALPLLSAEFSAQGMVDGVRIEETPAEIAASSAVMIAP